MKPVSILDSTQFQLTITRLCQQLIENHGDFSSTVLVGIQPRGVFLARRIQKVLHKIIGAEVTIGELDVTFFRDDFRRRIEPLKASSTKMDLLVEKKKVIFVDDVLYSGRTIRSGLDALQAYGRPAKVELLVLIDRRFKRQLPIQADYTGMTVDSIESERISVSWKEADGKDEVKLYTIKSENG